MWLICAATAGELATWDDGIFPGDERFVSGVGIPETLARLLPKVLAGGYERIVNIGIAGAYPSSGLVVGDIVIARREVYGDVGMELPDAPGFWAISATPFGAAYADPFVLDCPSELRGGSAIPATGATVNVCAGTDATGRLREALFDAGFETMEGAAVAHVGRVAFVPVTEIRAISNIAAHRDMRPENIRLALSNLREYFAARART